MHIKRIPGKLVKAFERRRKNIYCHSMKLGSSVRRNKNIHKDRVDRKTQQMRKRRHNGQHGQLPKKYTYSTHNIHMIYIMYVSIALIIAQCNSYCKLE